MAIAVPENKRMVVEWVLVRDNAEALLRSLVDAKAESERRLSELNQRDQMKTATGRSSMDNAIASTRRMVATLNRLIEEAERDFTEEDLALLEPREASSPR